MQRICCCCELRLCREPPAVLCTCERKTAGSQLSGFYWSCPKTAHQQLMGIRCIKLQGCFSFIGFSLTSCDYWRPITQEISPIWGREISYQHPIPSSAGWISPLLISLYVGSPYWEWSISWPGLPPNEEWDQMFITVWITHETSLVSWDHRYITLFSFLYQKPQLAGCCFAEISPKNVVVKGQIDHILCS